MHITLHYSTYNSTNLAIMHTEKFVHTSLCLQEPQSTLAETTLQYLYGVQLSFEPAFHKRRTFVDHITLQWDR